MPAGCARPRLVQRWFIGRICWSAARFCSFPRCCCGCVTFWDPKRRWLATYTSYWGAHYLAWAPFASVRVEGLEHANPERPCVYVVNHQSMVDILAVFATHLPYLWVSKVENFYAPFLGWNMWLNGYVPLKRGFLPSILRMVRSCLKKLDQGHSLCVFPEGTRSPDGNLIDFYRGAFWVATKRGVPIVPIVVEGTGAILQKKRLQIRPQQTLVRVLPAIEPAQGGFRRPKVEGSGSRSDGRRADADPPRRALSACSGAPRTPQKPASDAAGGGPES